MAAFALPLRHLLPTTNHFTSSRILKLPSSWTVPLPLPTLTALAAPSWSQLANPPSFLQDIWNGILNAVPKKKMSYSRSRSRRLAGKGLKDILSVVKCPSCGRPKRSHFLCPYCVQAVRLFWKKAWQDLGVKIASAKPKVKDTSSISRAREPQEP